MGVFHKVHTFRFRNFNPPSPCTYAYAFSLHPFLPIMRSILRAQGYYFLKMMRLINFVNYSQWKSQKQCYKIKKLLHKGFGKCRIDVALFNYKGRWHWNGKANFLNSTFLFCNEAANSWTTPPTSERTCFMYGLLDSSDFVKTFIFCQIFLKYSIFPQIWTVKAPL